MTDEFSTEMNGLVEQIRGIQNELKANTSEYESFRSKCAELDTQLAELKEYQARSVTAVAPGTPTAEQVRAFNDFITRGIGAAAEVSGPRGGFLVPAELSADIMKKLYDIDVFRQYAKVISVGSNAVEVPVNTALPSVTWIGELETRAKDDKDYFSLANIPVDEEQITLPVSRRLLEDGVLTNMESYITGLMADALNKAEGEAFVKGTGFKQPQGLFNSNNGIPTVETAGSNALACDDMIDLWADVPNAVDDTGAYYVSKSIMARMRKLKETGTGAYLWQTPIAAGAPPTFNGFPVRILASAPYDITVDNELVAGFGALDKTYVVAERNSMFLLRDEYSAKSKGCIELTINRRVGGGVAAPDNFRLLKVKA